MLAAIAGSLAVFPLPAQITPAVGSFHVPKSAQVVFEGELPANDKRRLTFAVTSGLGFTTAKKGPIIRFKKLGLVSSKEAYRFTVSPTGIEVTAANATGMFWSVQTLRQMAQGGAIPCATVLDAPEFKWRGVMLDEGRHFMGESFVKQFLDVMTLYKFNVLHWHLTDDQGWRIEIKSRPELTKKGAWRTEADGTKHGGFYTQAQVKEIVRYAADRNITIVPEIEMPGHSSAAITAYPDLGCRRPKLKVPPTWGVFSDVYCAGRESTFAFLEDVITEVAALFPSSYFHIGGDEVPKDRWKECPDCQARIKREGLKDEHELQSWFIRRVQKSLTAKKKTLIGWDEIMEGGLAKGAVVQVWTDINQADKAVAAGNPVLLSPSSHLYLNRSARELPLKDVYGFEIPTHLDRPDVLGLETTLWSEEITTANCLPKFLPRGIAVAELFWSNPKKDLPAFRERLARHLPMLARLGIPVGPEDRAIASYSVEPGTGGVTVAMTPGMAGIDFRYTLDSSKPGPTSPTATPRFQVPLGKTLRVTPFVGKNRVDEPRIFETSAHLAVGARVSLSEEPAPQYGTGSLTDGLLGSTDFHDGIWLGWQGKDLTATLDLGKPIGFTEIGLRCLQQMRSWILMPKSVVFEVSEDGKEWALAGVDENTVADTEEVATLKWFKVSFKRGVLARYVRITAVSYGKLPAWHNGAGGDAWLFADEVVVK